MSSNIFQQKVKKQLWFLNKKEKRTLHKVLEEATSKDSEVDLKRPVRFSNQFLKEFIFQEKVVSVTTLFPLLIGILFAYIILIGVFLFGFITSLTAVQYFIKPEVSLSPLVVILTLIGSILLVILSLYFIKVATAYFTKKLLEYKHNSKL
ncbi:hypothetical protein BU600_11405 [Staphylococcus arlettae]|uniref:Putative staphylococcal protein n=3 Tax=Staphylococcus arlettae TaxID=29378 RepID=A0A2T7BXC5_9STAP|nr:MULTISPECIES: hypothetical protein [Staphylococcus]EJY95030.1 hypothetical protein SARL_09272 [Staphylococcus arlettae CVD059]ERF47946.1 hypothetical protein N039_06905 [Staphylococcus sp. EGD-HP3]KAB2478475.1 hypothetical protein F9B39_08465 [Staphylococcus sp. CH99b_3]MBF0738422.1 hypothetical protein [Staphylococcus arlettae]MBK3720401.1 hypothetical protein [Staphylococcus arlettae]